MMFDGMTTTEKASAILVMLLAGLIGISVSAILLRHALHLVAS